jgi:hypothetical protein
MNVYTNFPSTFTFETLPFAPTFSSQQRFTKREKAHVKEMHNNHVVQVIFRVQRLYSAFSLDRYWLSFPVIPLDQLEIILSILPDCHIFFTESNIHLRVRLTADLVSKIENDLDWDIKKIIPFNYPRRRDIDWFDIKKLQWQRPSILESKLE